MESTHLDGMQLVRAVQGFVDQHEEGRDVQRVLLDLLAIVDRHLDVYATRDEISPFYDYDEDSL